MIAIGMSKMNFTEDPFKISADERVRFQAMSEVANALEEIVWIARPDGQIDYYNRHWFKYTGLTLEQTREAGWISVIHPNDVRLCMEAWSNALKSEKPCNFEFRLLHADGSYRWHLGCVVPVLNSGREITRWLGIFQDIENQVHTQNVILESYERYKQKQLAYITELKASNANLMQEIATLRQAFENEAAEHKRLEDQLRVARQNEEMARYAAFHDALTSLPNRLLFNDRLKHGIAQAKRHDRMLAVMFLDLDKFKHINDTFGHAVGDKVLIEVANRLMKFTREDDTVCRQGGDEFLYLLMEIKKESDAVVIAKKIMHTLGKPCRIKSGNAIVSPDILPSIGIAIFPKDGDTPDALIKNADLAMYRAKQSKSGYAFA
jgi:diguanylate cyclase (GGDEF)-like protein/PAS domain S-box-containing protein